MKYIDGDEEFSSNQNFNTYLKEALVISKKGDIASNISALLYEVVDQIPRSMAQDMEMVSLYGFKNYAQYKEEIHDLTKGFLKDQFLNSNAGEELLLRTKGITKKERRLEIRKHIENSEDELDSTLLTHILSANTAKPELYNALREAVIEVGAKKFYDEHKEEGISDDECHSAYIGDLLGRMNGFVEQSIAIFRHSAPKPGGTLSLCGVDSEWYIRSFDSEKTPYEYFPPEYLAVTDLYHNFNFITQDCHVESEILDVLPDYVDKLHLLNILIYKDAQTMQDEDVPCQDFSDAPEWIPLHQNQTVIFEIEKVIVILCRILALLVVLIMCIWKSSLWKMH